MSAFDIVVLGSGFGGAVMAARLGAKAKALGKSVALFEKGYDHTGGFDEQSDGGPYNAQGNRFRHTLGPGYLASVLDVHSDRDGAFKSGVSSMNVASGKGFGGGSNVYDAVSLRAPTEAFEQSRDGKRLWPALYTRAALDPYYAKVEARLRVARLAWTDRDAPHWALATKRDFVFAEGCRRVGTTALPLKVATHDDANEGWWNQGQRFEGRQGLVKNYLLDAKASGVSMQSSCEITSIAPAKGGYVVSGIDRRGGGADVPFDVECKLLVIACGAVASTGLLLRSQKNFEGARSLDPKGALGRHLSGNGDYGVSGIIGSKFELDVEGHKGKPMSSFCPSYWAKDKFILIPFYAAPLHLAFGQPSTLLRAADPSARGRASTGVRAGERDWGLAYKARLRSFGSRMLTMGCLALDDCEGEVHLRDGEAIAVRWPRTSDATEARWNAAVSAMARIYEALGGEMFLDGYRKDGTVNTAHPLGGCRMTERDSGGGAGVTDPLGEALQNPNLFVVDGAIIPSALGTNPSLTIAAVAELVADRLVSGTDTKSLADRLA
jgi:cholesterol oxidase